MEIARTFPTTSELSTLNATSRHISVFAPHSRPVVKGSQRFQEKLKSFPSSTRSLGSQQAAWPCTFPRSSWVLAQPQLGLAQKAPGTTGFVNFFLLTGLFRCPFLSHSQLALAVLKSSVTPSAPFFKRRQGKVHCWSATVHAVES